MRFRQPKRQGQAPREGQPAEPNRRERQIVRILALLRVLAQGRKPTVHQLAAEFKTRRETIYRDLRVLQDAGYPIAGDERGRLSRPRLLATSIPNIRFSPPELESLLLAARQVQAALPRAEALASASLKLQALADSEPNAQPALSGIFDAWTCGAKDYRIHEGRIAVLIEAILRKRRCAVAYRTPTRRTAKAYDFDPYRLLFVGGGLYVLGRVPTHSGTATLAIDRFVSISLSKNTFEVDPAFDPKACRQDAFGVSRQDPQQIVLRFRADEAPY
ncbi:MAG: WYL domain-containing protein, partial [Acidobacteriia bacterium]|nr:WYL domain-containing protein [Terriglobia bacterium]